MTATTISTAAVDRLEDVLAYLPVSNTTEYSKGQTIYDPEIRSQCLYLLTKGKVGISRVAADGNEVLLEIARPDELFGEVGFLSAPYRYEKATALEKSTLMTWPISDMESLIVKRPRLALALLQIVVQRNAEFTRRIESFSFDTIERRLARSLIRFCERLGTQEEDGSVRMMPFTHEMLSRYVGTSREVVTHHMSRFRKQGHVVYSRNGIRLQRDNLARLLQNTA